MHTDQPEANNCEDLQRHQKNASFCATTNPGAMCGCLKRGHVHSSNAMAKDGKTMELCLASKLKAALSKVSITFCFARGRSKVYIYASLGDCTRSYEPGKGYAMGHGPQFVKVAEMPQVCQSMCYHKNWCTVWVYNKSTKMCYVKESHGGLYHDSNMVSGLKIHGCFGESYP